MVCHDLCFIILPLRYLWMMLMYFWDRRYHRIHLNYRMACIGWLILIQLRVGYVKVLRLHHSSMCIFSTHFKLKNSTTTEWTHWLQPWCATMHLWLLDLFTYCTRGWRIHYALSSWKFLSFFNKKNPLPSYPECADAFFIKTAWHSIFHSLTIRITNIF
jgi:hypothetical protein